MLPGRLALKSGSKVFKFQMLEFSPYIHTKWRVLTFWRLSSIMGPWRSIRVLFSRKPLKIVKIVIFFSFQKSIFFQQNAKKIVLGLREWSIREKTAFFLNFQNFYFSPILTTFDPALTWKRTEQILPFLVILKFKFQKWARKGGVGWQKVEFSIFPKIFIKNRVFWYFDHSVAPAELGDQFGSKSSKIAKIASQTTFTPL